MNKDRVYVIRENNYKDTLLKITISMNEDRQIFVKAERFCFEDSYNASLYREITSKETEPLLIDISTNECFLYDLQKAPFKEEDKI